jgi:hypothetical protein
MALASVVTIIPQYAIKKHRESQRGAMKNASYIDMMVISRQSSEGVVSHVRAYASGRVEIRMQR